MLGQRVTPEKPNEIIVILELPSTLALGGRPSPSMPTARKPHC